jgi:hypothetical protein
MNRRKLHESSHGPVIKDIKTFKLAVRKTEKISPQSGKKTKGYSLIYGFKGNALFIEANSIQDAFSKYQNNYQKYDAYISDDSFLRKESTDRNKKPLLETYKKLFGETPGGKKILKEEDDDMGDGEDFEEYDNEPQDEDIMISDARNGGYDIGIVGGRYLMSFDDWDEAISSIKTWMKKNKFYPTIWYQNDHGNISIVNESKKLVNE